MSPPSIQVLLGFGTTVNLGNYFVLDRSMLDAPGTPLAPDNVMVDVSQWLYGPLSISRGRSREVDAFQAGSASFTLHNEDRRFDPTNTASPYYPGVVPKAPVSIAIAGRQVYGGYVDNYDVLYRKPNIVDLNVSALDGFSLLSLTKLQAAVFAQETSGVRITNVLSRPEVSYPDVTVIDAGQMTMQGSTQDNVGALDHCQVIAASEAGYFFVDNTGTLTFKDKTWLSQRLATYPQGRATFTDTGVAYAGLAYGYTDITLTMGTVLLFNRCEGARSGGTRQIANDVNSQAQYGIRALSLPQLENYQDIDVLGICGVFVDRYKQPEVRFSNVVIELSGLSLAQQELLSDLDIGSIVIAERSPPGSGTPAKITQTAAIEQMTWTLDVASSSYRLTLALRNTAGHAGLVLNDATLGVLDTGKLA
jgi:hypothetical protein